MTIEEKLAWLAGLEVGSEVAMERRLGAFRPSIITIATITHTTKTRVHVGDDVFTRTERWPGYGYGRTSGRIHPVTDEIRAECEARVLRSRFRDISRKADYSETFPIWAIEAMVKAYDQALAEHGEKERSKCKESQ